MASIPALHPGSILADARVMRSGVPELLGRTRTGQQYLERIGALPAKTIHLDEPNRWSVMFNQMKAVDPQLESIGGIYVFIANTMALPPGALDNAEQAAEIILHEGVHRLQRGSTPKYITGRIKAATIDVLTLPWKATGRALRELVTGDGPAGSRLAAGWNDQIRLRALRVEGEAYNVQKRYVRELYEIGVREPERVGGQWQLIDRLIQQEDELGRALTDDEVTLLMPHGTIYDAKPRMHALLAKASAAGQASAGVWYLSTRKEEG